MLVYMGYKKKSEARAGCAWVRRRSQRQGLGVLTSSEGKVNKSETKNITCTNAHRRVGIHRGCNSVPPDNTGDYT